MIERKHVRRFIRCHFITFDNIEHLSQTSDNSLNAVSRLYASQPFIVDVLARQSR